MCQCCRMMLVVLLAASQGLLASLVSAAAIGPAPQRCPLQNGNLLDVDLFVADDAACQVC